MLLVLFPVALIPCPFHIRVYTESVRLIIHPCTIVDVPVCVIEFAIAAGLIILPVALVARRVDPDHGAPAMAQSTFPLSCVHSTRAVRV